MLHFYNNEESEREIQEAIPFITASKRIPRNKPTWGDKRSVLCTMLMKEIEENINRWKDVPCSWTGRINTVKMTITQGNLQIQCNPYQITNGIFHRIRTQNFTICMETQKTLNRQRDFEGKKGKLEESVSLTSDYATDHNNQNNMVQNKYRLMKEDTKSRDKLMFLTLFYQYFIRVHLSKLRIHIIATLKCKFYLNSNSFPTNILFLFIDPIQDTTLRFVLSP